MIGMYRIEGGPPLLKMNINYLWNIGDGRDKLISLRRQLGLIRHITAHPKLCIMVDWYDLNV